MAVFLRLRFRLTRHRARISYVIAGFADKIDGDVRFGEKFADRLGPLVDSFGHVGIEGLTMKGVIQNGSLVGDFLSRRYSGVGAYLGYCSIFRTRSQILFAGFRLIRRRGGRVDAGFWFPNIVPPGRARVVTKSDSRARRQLFLEFWQPGLDGANWTSV